MALLFGAIWTASYMVLGRMHGMWPMFNGELPFAAARLFTSQVDKLPVGLGAFFAFVDGAVAGLAGSWTMLLAITISTGVEREP
jgi:hypothetical protein